MRLRHPTSGVYFLTGQYLRRCVGLPIPQISLWEPSFDSQLWGRGSLAHALTRNCWTATRLIPLPLLPHSETAADRHNFCTQITSFRFLSLNFCWPHAVLVPVPEFCWGVFTLLVRSSRIESLGGTFPREYVFRWWVFSCRGAACKICFCSPELHSLFCFSSLSSRLTFVNRFCII